MLLETVVVRLLEHRGALNRIDLVYQVSAAEPRSPSTSGFCAAFLSKQAWAAAFSRLSAAYGHNASMADDEVAIQAAVENTFATGVDSR